MSRLFAVLFPLVALLVPLHLYASQHYKIARNVEKVMFEKAFEDEGLVFEGSKTRKLIRQSIILGDAKLDHSIPFKAAGIDSAKVTQALNKVSIMIHLMGAGIHWMTVFSMIDHARLQKLDFTYKSGSLGAPYVLWCGLKAGGQDYEIEKLKTVLKQAHVLGDAGILPATAFKAAGIDLEKIPVSKDKYTKLISKYRRVYKFPK